MDAAAACSPPGLMVLSSSLVVHLPNVSPGPEWVPVECATKEAYGCGDLGDRLLHGLNLLVRRVGYLNLDSSLSIDLSYGALFSIQEDLGVPDHLQGLHGDMPRIEGTVQIAEAQVPYDATVASLYMIPYISNDLEATCTRVPVPARPAGGRGGHELALAARKVWSLPGGAERGRLCVCTPAARAAAAAARPDGGDAGPWEMKVHGCSQKLLQPFRVDVAFSLGDKVFWADLSRGVACSDLRQGGSSVVDVVFIKLPDGCQIDYRRNVEIDPVKMSRTMGCVHGSIKFVCIDRGVTPPENKIVKAWTLDLDRQEWKEDEGFTCRWEELWLKMRTMNNARLKDVPLLEPQYPVLMPDGALCLLLPSTRHRWGTSVKRPDYICSFDMFSKSCLCFGLVRDYHIIRPIVLPVNFFKDCYPAPKRKPPTRKRKLLPAVREG